jgi:hypothetical protein
MVEVEPEGDLGLRNPCRNHLGSGGSSIRQQDLDVVGGNLPDEVCRAQALARSPREPRQRDGPSAISARSRPATHDQQAEPACAAIGKAALTLEKSRELACGEGARLVVREHSRPAGRPFLGHLAARMSLWSALTEPTVHARGGSIVRRGHAGRHTG